MPRIALLYSHHNRVLLCLSSPETQPLLSYLQEWLEEVESDLRFSSDINEIKKAQGKDEVLRRILGLEKELKEYGNKLMRGEVKKVELPKGVTNGLAKV